MTAREAFLVTYYDLEISAHDLIRVVSNPAILVEQLSAAAWITGAAEQPTTEQKSRAAGLACAPPTDESS